MPARREPSQSPDSHRTAAESSPESWQTTPAAKGDHLKPPNPGSVDETMSSRSGLQSVSPASEECKSCSVNSVSDADSDASPRTPVPKEVTPPTATPPPTEVSLQQQYLRLRANPPPVPPEGKDSRPVDPHDPYYEQRLMAFSETVQTCVLCCVGFNSKLMQMSHFQGARHKQALFAAQKRGARISDVMAKFKKAYWVAVNWNTYPTYEDPNPNEHCELCNVDLPTQAQRLTHYGITVDPETGETRDDPNTGRKHKDNVRRHAQGQTPRRRQERLDIYDSAWDKIPIHNRSMIEKTQREVSRKKKAKLAALRDTSKK